MSFTKFNDLIDFFIDFFIVWAQFLGAFLDDFHVEISSEPEKNNFAKKLTKQRPWRQN